MLRFTLSWRIDLIFFWRRQFLDTSNLEKLVMPEIGDLGQIMARVLGSDHPFLEELNQRIMANPGKRLRPKLLVLCSKMLGYQGPLATLYACVFELIHTATLIHDDILDEAKMRRGVQTLNTELGNTISVLYGDLLYTKAHSTAIEAGRLDVLATITSVSERMIEGELLQEKFNFNLDISEAVYFDILKRKTAHLFAGTTQTAGLIADQSPEQVNAMYQFGFHFGTSFQLMDDYLDYVSTANQMGKPVLSDLKNGKVTLPIIKLMQQDDGSFRTAIEKFWQNNESGIPEEMVHALETGEGLKDTLALAKDAAAKAVAHLQDFPQNPYAAVLRKLPFYLLERRT